MSAPAVIFDSVSIVFGDRPETALPLMDQGLDRAEIRRRTGQVLGVHDCSLTVAEGEILVLMGLSGSGKSTLLRAVNRLNPVVRGRVVIRDGDWTADVTRATPQELLRIRRECVAMVFQQFGLLPWRTVAENVGLGLELGGLPRAGRADRVARQLALVGLSDWGSRRVGELSGGMQQRVGLARAFATEAPILLMDEPFSALDPLIRTRLQGELLELQARLRRTIVFVSHDLDEAFRLGNRIAILDGGRIVQCGTPRDIFMTPATPHVAEFVAQMDPLAVLTAADLTGADPAGADGPAAGTIPAAMPVREVMRRVQEQGPQAVERDGQRLGVVTGGSLLARLLDPRGRGSG